VLQVSPATDATKKSPSETVVNQTLLAAYKLFKQAQVLFLAGMSDFDCFIF
jgi:hypothetical protein